MPTLIIKTNCQCVMYNLRQVSRTKVRMHVNGHTRRL